jgi:hypothetical protein
VNRRPTPILKAEKLLEEAIGLLRRPALMHQVDPDKLSQAIYHAVESNMGGMFDTPEFFASNVAELYPLVVAGKLPDLDKNKPRSIRVRRPMSEEKMHRAFDALEDIYLMQRETIETVSPKGRKRKRVKYTDIGCQKAATILVGAYNRA